ncbi:MAG TPA: acyl carrier protein [Anaerolineales bacterium]|nr:acyl carrier protein [Anaerolineales bacterium]
MTTNDVIRDFITKEIMHNPSGALVGDDEPLIESGIIDSLGIMTLLSFVEGEFSIEIPGDELLPENFSSIAAITALVERRKA